MTRIITVGAAQLGPIQRADSRARVVARMLASAAAGRRAQMQPRGLPRAGAHDLLPALVDDRPGGDRQLLRARDAVERDGAAVQRGAAAGCRLQSGLCRDRAPRCRRASLQYVDPGRCRRQDRRQVPQDPSPRPCRARAPARFPAPGEALLRGGRPGLWRVEDDGRQLRHVHLQRPALARDLSRHGPAERRDGRARLQHAAAQSAGARPRPP